MKKEELILCIKKSGDGRDIELDRLTLADALLFKELLASFTELLQNYDDASKFRLNVFKSIAAVKLEAEESFLKLVENDIDSAMNRKPIRTGALKKWQTLQQVISNEELDFEITCCNVCHFFNAPVLMGFRFIALSMSFSISFIKLSSDSSFTAALDLNTFNRNLEASS